MNPGKGFLALLVMLFSQAVFAYPAVTIKNNTDYTFYGTVEYPGCSDDDYRVGPGQTWTGPYRGGLSDNEYHRQVRRLSQTR